jgi:ADP-dependent NAD(P)H-hydrate dehydratase / NAD(P)H-hydrate epimerase
VQATRTVTFFRRKPGHLLYPGRQLCGDIALYDIGMPVAVLDNIGVRTFVNASPLWRGQLPRLDVKGHKYTRGHAVVVSGGIEMSGAARLCARGALRVGAGLVTVASPPDALQAHAAQLNATLLKTGTLPADIAQLLVDRRFTAVGIGPGLGRADHAMEQVMAVVASDTAVMLDADALTVAAASSEVLFRAIAARKRAVVLTPHEGEFKRLFPDVAGSKLERARAAATISGGVVLLKGADTVIASPDGRAAINENAPPWLATAGSGDVLAGFVTGLLAQGMPAFEAACAAVWLHGECANSFGPGLIAEDIPEALPKVLAKLLAASS